MAKVKELKRGSVVHCDFTGGVQRLLILATRLPLPPPGRIALGLLSLLPSPSHSGIYLSEKEIISLNGDGFVVVQTPKKFLRGLAKRIYVGCIGEKSVSFPSAADEAEKRVGIEQYPYHIRINNCHKFVCACVRGDFYGKYKMSGKFSGKGKSWLLKDVKDVIKEVRSEAYHGDSGRFNWRVWDKHSPKR